MFADIKTYIFYQLFEKYVIDYSMASATGMFNLEKLDWDKEALELMGITEDNYHNWYLRHIFLKV